MDRFALPTPTVMVKKGSFLYRSRTYDPNEHPEFYHDASQLCHVKDVSKIHWGRANEPEQSIFYCSDDPRTSFAETSINVRYSLDLEKETIVTGIWEVKESFNVANIITNNSIKGINKTMDGLQTRFEEMIKLLKKVDTTDLTIQTLELFSNEFTRVVKNDTTEYFISCAYANYIYNNPHGNDMYTNAETESYGILYPSVMLNSVGMNLAIKPKVIDLGILELKEVHRRTSYKVADKKYDFEPIIKSKIIDRNRGIIYW